MTETSRVAERIILALDFARMDEVERCLNELSGQVQYVKVGMELFYAEGLRIVDVLKERGLRVFLDLKVHDIPNTAKGAMRSLAAHGVDMVTLHAAGGRAMMEAAREGLEAGVVGGTPRPLAVAVTMLTSTSREMMNTQIGIPGSVEDTVVAYARLAHQSGMDGIVASPLEVPAVKQATHPAFLAVTPGIRPAGADKGDQQRTATPLEAFRLGSDYLVVGRAVTAAADRLAAWKSVLAGISYDIVGKGESVR